MIMGTSAPSRAEYEPASLPAGLGERRRDRKRSLGGLSLRRAVGRRFALFPVYLDLALAGLSRCWTTIPIGSAKKIGYFGGLGIKTDMQPGPSDGTATVKFVDVGQADMGFPSPGVFSFALQNGMKLKSVFHEGALDTFSLASSAPAGVRRI